MPPIVLGLDIGGANLKAATADKRALSLPFPLWKEPDRLPAKLAELLGHFPDADEFAVTMTGELCDCYETKRQGVNAILTAVQNVSRSRPIRVWGTDGTFRNVEEARRDYLQVAAANWHALATFAGGYVPEGKAVLVDVGSTTTDIIPIVNGEPVPVGRTDSERLACKELVYTGVRRTPVVALISASGVAAELFATTLDAYLMTGLLPDDATDTGTADGRPATRHHAHARLSRMLCGDAELTDESKTRRLAEQVRDAQHGLLYDALVEQIRQLKKHSQSPAYPRRVAITSGSGEFLARRLVSEFESRPFDDFISLNDRLGPTASACAPAYALAVLGTERRS
jgi:probable H4MPT-linked C1 transfer pathway protein